MIRAGRDIYLVNMINSYSVFQLLIFFSPSKWQLASLLFHPSLLLVTQIIPDNYTNNCSHIQTLGCCFIFFSYFMYLFYFYVQHLWNAVSFSLLFFRLTTCDIVASVIIIIHRSIHRLIGRQLYLCNGQLFSTWVNFWITSSKHLNSC